METPRRTNQEVYAAFIRFIQKELQQERSTKNRRMFGVLFWCFFLPVLSFIVLGALSRSGIVPVNIRGLMDWLILIFPISYAVYFMGPDLLREIPGAFKRGGWAATIDKAVDEGQWRYETSLALQSSLSATPEQWGWVAESFQTDLESLHNRTKYMTALAGAVLFFIVQGFELWEAPTDVSIDLTALGVLAWLQGVSEEFAELVALGFFLLLMYLSGRQMQQSLERYLHCVNLIRLKDD